MDFLFLKLWIDETSRQIINSPFRNVFLDGEKYILEFDGSHFIVSLFSGESICFFSNREANQKIETTFTKLISQHLNKSQIKNIKIAENDKVISILFQKVDIYSKEIKYKLILELINRYENMILARKDETGKWIILDSHRRIGFSESRYRQILPGNEYKSPPSIDKPYLLEIRKEEFVSLIGNNLPQNWQDFIKHFSNVPKFFKDEFVSEMPAEDFWKIISQIKNTIKALEPSASSEAESRQIGDWRTESDKLNKISNNPFSEGMSGVNPNPSQGDIKHIIFYNPENKLFSLIKKENSQGFSTINDAFQFYYVEKCQNVRLNQLKDNILHKLKKQSEQIEKTIEKESAEFSQMEDAEKWKKFGELLKANFDKIKKRQKEIKVIDYFTENAPLISIPLNEEWNAHKNVESYFKKYKKAKSGKAKLLIHIGANKKKLQNILDKIASIKKCNAIEELHELEEEKRGKKKKINVKQPFRRFSVKMGEREWEIFVGRNNRENDELTTKFAKPDDWFFHSRIYHGAHIIVRNPERLESLPDKIKYFAARIAAYFSKAKHSTKVPVDFTKIRYVSKPRKSPPGFVVYRNQKTLFVDPIDPRKIR